MIYLYIGAVIAFEFVNLKFLNGELNSVYFLIIISTIFVLAKLNSLKEKIDYIEDHPLHWLCNDVDNLGKKLESIESQIGSIELDTEYVKDYVDWLETVANSPTEEKDDIDHIGDYIDWLGEKIDDETKKMENTIESLK